MSHNTLSEFAINLAGTYAEGDDVCTVWAQSERGECVGHVDVDVGKGRRKARGVRRFKLTKVVFTPPNRTVTGLAKLAGDDTGATAVEYALILGGIAFLIIVTVFLLGGKTNSLFEKGLWP